MSLITGVTPTGCHHSSLLCDQSDRHTCTQPLHLVCPIGTVCLLVIGMLSLPQSHPVPDLRLTHSISAHWKDLIEAHTYSSPCGIGQGLLRFVGQLPVDQSACLSPSVLIWMNNTQADVQHRHWSTDTVHYTLTLSLCQSSNITVLLWLTPLQGSCLLLRC